MSTFAGIAKADRISNGSSSEAGLPGTDPLTEVYRAIWARLGSNSLFAAAVPVPNRARHDVATNPKLQNRQDAHYPRVSLTPSGGSFSWPASDLVEVVQSFALEVESIEPNISLMLLPLKWAILQVHATLTDNLGLPFVHNIEIDATFEDRRAAEASTSMVWYHLADIRVEMQFGRDTIIHGASR